MSTINNKSIINSIFLSYDSKLQDLCYWYQQLVGESLGKQKKGIMPIVSIAPKDNHSLLQLYLDGPRDKFFTFFSSKNNIKSYKFSGKNIPKSIGYIKNKTLKKIINSQLKATKNVFKSKKIPFREFNCIKNNEQEFGDIIIFLILDTILLDRMMKVANNIENISLITESLIKEAIKIHNEDIQSNHNIGKLGAKLLSQNTKILTHCNAGALATGGYGTALGVIKYANYQGKISKVYSTETRPLLQGSRLTIWELINSNIDACSIPDSAAGHLMKLNEINTIIVGADRITSNGDVANKIGTYTLAILAKIHNINFYVAAPTSTIDMKLTNGSQIPIEERGRTELARINNIKIIQDDIKIYNPAFDVTPNKFIKSIITEKGIISPPYGLNIKKLMKGNNE